MGDKIFIGKRAFSFGIFHFRDISYPENPLNGKLLIIH